MHRGNDRIHHPVSRPKSLEISVTRIPDPEEWNEDWYTSWKERRDNPNNLIAFAEHELKASFAEGDIDIKENDSMLLDAPVHGPNAPLKIVKIEIGTLCPVRLKTGERLSRIHPEFTSSLRRSRWRKKYIAGVHFPGN